jgi:hypothetical protein
MAYLILFYCNVLPESAKISGLKTGFGGGIRWADAIKNWGC